MANGRPRDELRIDIEAGRPGIAPDIDALALRCAALLDDKRASWFWNSLDYRIVKSSTCADWMNRPMTYLQDLDPEATEVIRRHVASTYEKDSRLRYGAVGMLSSLGDGSRNMIKVGRTYHCANHLCWLLVIHFPYVTPGRVLRSLGSEESGDQVGGHGGSGSAQRHDVRFIHDAFERCNRDAVGRKHLPYSVTRRLSSCLE